MVKRKKKPTVRIPREWYPILPGQPLTFWVRVDEVRRRRGITKKNMDGIRQCVDEVFNV